jgi:hypothetical protein
MAQIQRIEWRWVALFAIFCLGLTCVPYLVGLSAQTSAQRFSGAVIGSADINSYLAKMNQGARGAWLFTLPYSSEPQQGVPLYLFHLLLGKISGPDFTSRVLTYHLARLFFGFLLILITYRFLAEFLPQVNQRRLALTLVTLGGGLGWLLILSGNVTWFDTLPLEFYSPETYSFLMLLLLPHLLLARCLLLAAVLAFLYKKYTWAGLALLPLGLLQPATVVVAWAVFGASAFVHIGCEKDFSPQNIWKKLRPIGLIGLISAPLMLYLGSLFLSNPILIPWNAQNLSLTPHPLHYLSGYGLYLLLAGFGIQPLKRSRPDLWRLAVGWTVVTPVLLYLPIGIQRRLVEGFQIPLVAVAVLGLTVRLYAFRHWLMPLTLCLVLPSSLLLWTGAIGSALSQAEPVYQSADELAALDWLDKNAQPGQVVLGAFFTGNVLPARTGLIPYIGHEVETVHIAAKRVRVAEFYRSETSADERLRLLAEGHIRYVFYGPNERDLGLLDLATLPGLTERFRQGACAVHEVTP